MGYSLLCADRQPGDRSGQHAAGEIGPGSPNQQLWRIFFTTTDSMGQHTMIGRRTSDGANQSGRAGAHKLDTAHSKPGSSGELSASPSVRVSARRSSASTRR